MSAPRRSPLREAGEYRHVTSVTLGHDVRIPPFPMPSVNASMRAEVPAAPQMVPAGTEFLVPTFEGEARPAMRRA
jgi:hypothetical protein